MIITEVLKNFIKCYKAFNGLTHLTDEEVAKQINRGDCGVAAIAVHYVLLNKYQISTHLLSNRSHCWLRFDGDDYDTLEPTGYHPDRMANITWTRGDIPDDLHEDRLSDACREWMPCDALGGYLVKAFVEHYDLPMIPELQHCIDNAAEYERAEEVPVLEGKYQRAKEL